LEVRAVLAGDRVDSRPELPAQLAMDQCAVEKLLPGALGSLDKLLQPRSLLGRDRAVKQRIHELGQLVEQLVVPDHA
jgi:hypothetical protein